MDKLIRPQNLATDQWTNALFTIFLLFSGFLYLTRISFDKSSCFWISGASPGLISALLINLFVLLFGVDEFSFFLEDREIFFRRDSLFLWSFLFPFSSFLIFLYCQSSLCYFRFWEASPLVGNGIDMSIGDVELSDQYQFRLRKRHNSFHFQFVLRGLSYDYVNAVPSLLLRFFSLIVPFSKG